MPTLVLAVDQSLWMMSSVPQVPANYWSALADQFCHTTVVTLLMLVWGVKVSVVFISVRDVQCNQLHLVHSSLHNWSAATGRR